MGYGSQDPRSTINLSIEKEELQQKADRSLELLGYPAQDFTSDITFEANRSLLDSMQYKEGRSELVEQLHQAPVSNLNPFFWEVQYRSTEDSLGQGVGNDDENEPDENGLRMRFDMAGNPIELINDGAIMPSKIVNRAVLASIFGENKEQAQQELSTATDSTLVPKFIFANQPNDPPSVNGSLSPLSRLDTLFTTRRPILLFRDDIFNMASYYLGQTGWDTSTLRKDTVRLGRLNGAGTATARYQWTEPRLDQALRVNVRLTSTGGLVSLSSHYNPDNNEENLLQDIWPGLRSILIFLFSIAAIFLFFFRIRARAIDTTPALIVAVMGGVMVSVQMLLASISQIGLLTDTGNWTINIFILIGIGIAGAASSVGFFIVTAIGDSITRQYWEAKLNLYDYLRQGMVFNKPIGSMLMRSVALSFVLAGIWTALLWLFPNLYIDIENVFLHDRAAWPPLNMMLYSGWITLSIGLSIFLVLGGQVYAQTSSNIVTSVFMVLACTIVVPVFGSYGPLLQEIIVASVIGLALTLIYLQWDILTLLLSQFLFMGLISTASGWIVDDSMDSYIFIFFMVLMGLLLVVGIWSVVKGKEEEGLSQFVPDYVDKLAQEERIKQELRIARNVQESFLPVRPPEFEHLELAGICKPAHETGGDYYDFVQLDDHRLAVAIGDVSGKGIQAAFYMTFIKGILHSLCREIESPAELLKKTNRLFCENAPRGIFISLAYGIIDLDKQEFRFARAGHNPALRLNSERGEIEELQPKGIGIGLAPGRSFDANIEEMTIKLSEDDALVLYTDGIVEALNKNHTFYGTHRLTNVLAKHGDTSAVNMVNVLSEDLKTYIGKAKQHDDMTVVIMKLKA